MVYKHKAERYSKGYSCWDDFVATLTKFLPSNAEQFPISPGTSVQDVISQLGIPTEEVKLIFIDGIKKDITTILQGGERLAIFPPVGGG